MQATILLIPGMLNDPSIWDDVRPLLTPWSQVRVLDVLPHDDLPSMAHAGWQLLADVPAQAPLLLAGFSMGGYVAQEMLALAPRALQGLLLLSTQAQPESPQSLEGRQKAIAAMQADFARTVEGVLKYSMHAPQPEQIERMRRMMLAIGPERAVAQLRAIAQRRDHRALLAGSTLPMRIVCGEEDRVTPMAMSEDIARCAPQAPLTRLPGIGHMVPLQQPQAVADALRGLLGA